MEEISVTEAQLVVFTLGDTLYGADVTQIREITEMLDITEIPGSSYFVEGVTNLRGQVTTVIDLRKRFGLEEKKRDKESRIIIAEPNGTPIGMIVDNVLEVMRISSNEIESTPELSDNSNANYIKGIAKLNDGTLMIVVDIEIIITGT